MRKQEKAEEELKNEEISKKMGINFFNFFFFFAFDAAIGGPTCVCACGEVFFSSFRVRKKKKNMCMKIILSHTQKRGLATL